MGLARPSAADLVPVDVLEGENTLGAIRELLAELRAGRALATPKAADARLLVKLSHRLDI